MSDWCILRCRGSNTLRLAASLNGADIEAWTPTEVQVVEKPLPRTICGVAKVEVTLALIPSFVFARSAHQAELIELSRSPSLLYRIWDSEQRKMVVKGHPEFSVWHPFGEVATVPDAALAHLRLVERRRKPRGEVKMFKIGDRVKLVDGAVAGLHGVVVATRGKRATVTFPDSGYARDAEVPMHALLDDDTESNVSSGQSERAQIARAA